mgnify:CR=1 FL=1
MFKIADIDDLARQRLYGAPQVNVVDDARMSSGIPLFTEKDVHETQHCLDIILRSMFVKKRISREYFNAKCREKAMEQGYLPTQATTTGSNLVRTLVNGNITISRFLEALQVLDLTLADMSVKVKSTKGADEMFGIQDTVSKK